ncbi:hypothetical protein [Aquibacillus rhizosphaerae]|uniref:Uncharacterized protein n=1 Tax=Aquibacillus rhizosphaerae TaxID=3051431 RepID=A0ABT7L393_9BACI|nr:hypothetical protein [Aquibacillus sp. LR5S19]MDL4840331.1 hypothetical protein [Aquibacillus sp. LR5S19]
MSAIISVFLYLIVLFGVSSILFFSLVSIWSTTEPVIAYLLSLIITHLILNTFGQIGKRDN